MAKKSSHRKIQREKTSPKKVEIIDVEKDKEPAESLENTEQSAEKKSVDTISKKSVQQKKDGSKNKTVKGKISKKSQLQKKAKSGSNGESAKKKKGAAQKTSSKKKLDTSDKKKGAHKASDDNKAKDEKAEAKEEKKTLDQQFFDYIDGVISKIKKPIIIWRKATSKKLIVFSDAVSEKYHTIRDEIVEFFRSTLWKSILKVLKIVFISVSIFIIICFIIIASLNWYYQDKILPNIYVAGIPVGTMTVDSAKELVREKVEKFEKDSFIFAFEERKYKLTFEDLLIETEFDKSFENAFYWGHTASHLENQKHLLEAFITPRDVPIVFDYDIGILEQQMEKFVEEISTPPKNAEIILNEAGKFEIIPSTMSVTTDFSVAYDKVLHQLSTLKAEVIELPKITAYPAIDDAEAKSALKYIQDYLLKKSITLVYDAYHKSLVPYTISIGEDPTWLTFSEKNDNLAISLDEDRLRTVIETDIAPQINQDHHNATIILPEEGEKYAKLDDMPMDGFYLREEDTIANIQSALHDTAFEESLVELSVEYEKGLILDQDGNDVGLTDLLGVGRSNFDGSSSARIFNIDKGLRLYNNLVIRPGEIFDFNEILGPVTFANGWKAELAIFSGGYETKPVAGGGLCQVSTTMYRAAVESGLEVVERRPHSYLVSYYVKDSDPLTGIDATIYPGSQNLRFKNNTPGIILIQTYIDGNDPVIKFYGTDDGRKVILDGPYKSGWYGAGAPVLEPTTDLPPGEVKITHHAHSGRTITWYQTIVGADGEEEKITINSTYRAIPAKGLIGAGAE